MLTSQKRPRPLNYDLELLQRSLNGRNACKIVLAFKDSEALDMSTVSELIRVLRYFKIPMSRGKMLIDQALGLIASSLFFFL